MAPLLRATVTPGKLPTCGWAPVLSLIHVALGSGQQVNLCVQWTKLVNAAAVHTLVLVFQPSTPHMLLYQVQDLLDLALFTLEAIIELLVHLSLIHI